MPRKEHAISTSSPACAVMSWGVSVKRAAGDRARAAGMCHCHSKGRCQRPREQGRQEHQDPSWANRPSPQPFAWDSGRKGREQKPLIPPPALPSGTLPQGDRAPAHLRGVTNEYSIRLDQSTNEKQILV